MTSTSRRLGEPKERIRCAAHARLAPPHHSIPHRPRPRPRPPRRAMRHAPCALPDQRPHSCWPSPPQPLAVCHGGLLAPQLVSHGLITAVQASLLEEVRCGAVMSVLWGVQCRGVRRLGPSESNRSQCKWSNLSCSHGKSSDCEDG